MVTFTTGIFLGLGIGGTGMGAYVKKDALYGLTLGLIQAVATVAIDRLLGRRMSAIYLAGIVIYGAGVVIKQAMVTTHIQPPQLPPSKRLTAQQRCEITKQNLRYLEEGFYTLPGSDEMERFPLTSGDTLCRASERFDILSSINIQPKHADMKVTVVNKDFLDAAHEEVKAGHSVAVVSFGSPREPGGGFEEGTIGQEEDLCYRSELAGFMHDQVYNKFGTDRQFYPIYDHIIHTPRVTVFRENLGKLYTLLRDPFQVGVLSTAAPVKPELREADYANEEDRQKVTNLIITQLYIAYAKGYDTIILGAFGCGAFKNPPKAVAEIYRDVIDRFFQKAFKKIIFAILDDHSSQGSHNPEGNFKPFADCFK